jgi:hypothetical protein
MEKEFIDVLNDAEKKFNAKKVIYADTWKVLSLDSLNTRLNGEVAELNEHSPEFFGKRAYEESLDVVNVALMLASRIKKAGGFK